MANRNQQRESSIIHVVKGVWDIFCDMVSDVLNPTLYDNWPYDNYGRSPLYGDPPRNIGASVKDKRVISTKLCPSCGKHRPLAKFYGQFGGQEYPICSNCQDHYSGDRRRFVSKAEQYENNRLPLLENRTVEKIKLDYYEVKLDEPKSYSFLDPLIDGEKYTTWDRLSWNNTWYKERRQKSKSSQRTYALPPWVYPGPPRSHYEKEQRKHYERLWRSGLDECIPTLLTKKISWRLFWNHFKFTEIAIYHLEKEGGEGDPKEKGLIN